MEGENQSERKKYESYMIDQLIITNVPGIPGEVDEIDGLEELEESKEPNLINTNEENSDIEKVSVINEQESEPDKSFINQL